MAANNILGFQINGLDAESCVADLMQHLEAGGSEKQCKWLACLNPHSYAMSLEDQRFGQALHEANWLVPDGSGVVLASRFLGGSIARRVTGSDVFQGVCSAMNAKGQCRVFFLGSTEQTLASIRARLSVDYPNLQVVGTYSPPFKPEFTREEMDDMVAAINSAAPDFLWVGMTAPKQEKWLLQQAPRLNVPCAAAIGAVFDFYAGNVKRSHPLFQKLHLEWLPRLIREPTRLWRRMGVSAPIFIWHVLKQRFKSS